MPRTALLLLLGLELALAIAYVVDVLLHRHAHPLLNFDGQLSAISVLQALLLFGVGMAMVTIMVVRQRLAHPPSWFLLIVLATLSFYGALDEVFKIHIALRQFNWIGIYSTLLVVVPLFCYQDLRRFWQLHRWTVLWVLIGISIFALGGFGAEVLKHAILQPLLSHYYSTAGFVIEKVRVGIEELLETVGETIVLYGVGLYVVEAIATPPRQHP